ncbi:T-lymphocyte activation antigen CD80 isoform X1 [Myotis daubentonii]|uniref:T-lymphocyte activation antigen CD80 isoform X1 n=1 Tax=Myotis daubentonii TaxID=98922 RepID=UPI002873E148|nr:T-lymphocyte activation antigen CD80 isoform X1 [Myotis daubentonii]XP_059543739.1 T-lymphocyte activation antigen CD80 isoform X1 [Myotis daubentonii]XP_059543740.1 T-lymphocyte activation antigen CD80 isoform X1 [Myotis daubentonii]XP_059543741.1 T-lymphocyte activation antigen CD80 isoform X1 [Myotis daubentonii]XP_059543742.1 T-lymphocyte activation antigen CD80 isoform X1 [Myotis daubentonii]XP_059543744.1 T-lymphocyte activation antigen CD80 isoform X1 [Myotis daubentonii]
MGQTKWRTLPSRCSYLKLFQSLVLAGHFYFSSGIIQVTKPVNDRAVLSCDYNISTDELTKVRIYWQKNNSDMVLSVVSGKMEVWPKYKNRTVANIISNPFIVILGLRPSDKGIYSCVIQKPEKGAYKLGHLTSVMLSVTADFPVPSITELGNPATNIKRIICSTSGGFPKPHLSWLEKGKELNAIHTTVSQDPQTELYTISSELDFNVTNNHTFICLVKYGNLTVSQIFNWQKSEPKTSPFSQSWLWILIIVVGISAIVVIAVFCYCCLCNRPAARWRERRKSGESMEMKTISPIISGSAEASG